MPAGFAVARMRASQTVAQSNAPRGDADMLLTDYVEMKLDVMLGKPVIRGTRITVELIMRKMSEGATVESILEAYPHLTREGVLGAVDYAYRAVAHEELVVTQPPAETGD